MIKVITYGTYDMLHYGHIRLLERAKALGDYLIVGITSDSFDVARGKINVKQSLMERIAAVRNTGLADEIIVEEYQGQKIDDIRRMNVDIFTVGSDWVGHFDYLREYCEVVYLERTVGVSSTMLRSKARAIRLGLVGDNPFLNKFFRECRYVNGVEVAGLYAHGHEIYDDELLRISCVTSDYETFLDNVDAVYLASHPSEHYNQIKMAFERGVHVLCEAPIVTHSDELAELFQLAERHDCILTDAIKTAYSTAYYRLLLLIKSGIIGRVCSVEATCTSLRERDNNDAPVPLKRWNSICAWGPNAMLPVFQILGTGYAEKRISSYMSDDDTYFDNFTKIDFTYPRAVASIKVGKGVKSEGEMIISGTEGYVYVPAPWWKTDYFEVRYENPERNRRFFYQLEGEGIRYEIVSFTKAIETRKVNSYIESGVSSAIVNVINDFFDGRDMVSWS